jgi:UDP-glucose 4-epimerase
MNDLTQRWLVTGGAGFIGFHVAEALAKSGRRVRVVDNLSTGTRSNLASLPAEVEIVEGDLRDPEVCARAVAGVDVAFHIAALPSVPRSLANPWATHDNNVNATIRLVEASRLAGVRRLVFSSSSSVYGDTPVLPKSEEQEPLPRSPYAASKLAAEQYTLAYARAGLIEAVALRYFNVFGPRQPPDAQYAAVIPLIFRAAATGGTVTIFGDGNQTRDFTYVENVVAANVLAATLPAKSVSGHVFNVGAGTRTSLLELVGLIREVTGRAVRIDHAPPRAGDVRDSLASLERSVALLQYRPQVSLRAGLKRTWEWSRYTSVTAS